MELRSVPMRSNLPTRSGARVTNSSGSSLSISSNVWSFANTMASGLSMRRLLPNGGSRMAASSRLMVGWGGGG